MKLPSSHSKLFCGVLALIFTVQHGVLAHATEANFWKERQQATQQKLAALPTLPHINTPSPFVKTSGDKLRLPSTRARFFPNQFSTLREINQPVQQKSDTTIIHIQDIHQNAEAQKNISQTIRHLIQNGGVDLIALEGAFDSIDLSSLQNSSHPDIITNVADYLLNKNEISGPIHAALSYPASFPTMIGIDDQTYYDANVKAVQDSTPRKEEETSKWTARDQILTRQKKATFNPNLMAFDTIVSHYRSGDLSIGRYSNALINQSKANHTQLKNFSKAYKLESALNFTRVEAERRQLLEKLIPKLNQGHLNQLTQMSSAFRLQKITAADFYSFIESLCQTHRVPLSSTPELKNYVHYVILSDSINAKELFLEIKDAEEEIYARLAKTKEEKNLVLESEQHQLAGKLIDFSLTTEEWKDYTRGDDTLKSFESFYIHAEARDEAMAKNLLNAINKEKAKTVILVTGGFHSQGISSYLNKEGFTTYNVVPKLTKVDTKDGSAYLSVFSQQKTPLDLLFEGDTLFLAKAPVTPQTAWFTIPNLALALLESLTPGNVSKEREATFLNQLLGKRQGRYQAEATDQENQVLVESTFASGHSHTFQTDFKNGQLANHSSQLSTVKEDISIVGLNGLAFFSGQTWLIAIGLVVFISLHLKNIAIDFEASGIDPAHQQAVKRWVLSYTLTLISFSSLLFVAHFAPFTLLILTQQNPSLSWSLFTFMWAALISLAHQRYSQLAFSSLASSTALAPLTTSRPWSQKETQFRNVILNIEREAVGPISIRGLQSNLTVLFEIAAIEFVHAGQNAPPYTLMNSGVHYVEFNLDAISDEPEFRQAFWDAAGELLRHYWDSQYNPFQSNYRIAVKGAARMVSNIINPHTDLVSGRIVLDIGAGWGDASVGLVMNGAREVHALEPNGQFRELGAQNVKMTKMENQIKFKNGRAHKLPYDTGSMDAVFIRKLTPYLVPVHRMQMLAEIQRVLPDNGVLIIWDYIAETEHSEMWTPDEWEMILSQFGFEIFDAYTVQGQGNTFAGIKARKVPTEPQVNQLHATHPDIVNALHTWSGGRINLEWSKRITVFFEELVFGFLATAFLIQGWSGILIVLAAIGPLFVVYHMVSSEKGYRQWNNILGLLFLRITLSLVWLYGTVDPTTFILVAFLTYGLHQWVYNATNKTIIFEDAAIVLMSLIAYLSGHPYLVLLGLAFFIFAHFKNISVDFDDSGIDSTDRRATRKWVGSYLLTLISFSTLLFGAHLTPFAFLLLTQQTPTLAWSLLTLLWIVLVATLHRFYSDFALRHLNFSYALAPLAKGRKNRGKKGDKEKKKKTPQSSSRQRVHPLQERVNSLMAQISELIRVQPLPREEIQRRYNQLDNLAAQITGSLQLDVFLNKIRQVLGTPDPHVVEIGAPTETPHVNRDRWGDQSGWELGNLNELRQMYLVPHQEWIHHLFLSRLWPYLSHPDDLDLIMEVGAAQGALYDLAFESLANHFSQQGFSSWVQTDINRKLLDATSKHLKRTRRVDILDERHGVKPNSHRALISLATMDTFFPDQYPKLMKHMADIIENGGSLIHLFDIIPQPDVMQDMARQDGLEFFPRFVDILNGDFRPNGYYFIDWKTLVERYPSEEQMQDALFQEANAFRFDPMIMYQRMAEEGGVGPNTDRFIAMIRHIHELAQRYDVRIEEGESQTQAVVDKLKGVAEGMGLTVVEAGPLTHQVVMEHDQVPDISPTTNVVRMTNGGIAYASSPDIPQAYPQYRNPVFIELSMSVLHVVKGEAPPEMNEGLRRVQQHQLNLRPLVEGESNDRPTATESPAPSEPVDQRRPIADEDLSGLTGNRSHELAQTLHALLSGGNFDQLHRELRQAQQGDSYGKDIPISPNRPDNEEAIRQTGLRVGLSDPDQFPGIMLFFFLFLGDSFPRALLDQYLQQLGSVTVQDFIDAGLFVEVTDEREPAVRLNNVVFTSLTLRNDRPVYVLIDLPESYSHSQNNEHRRVYIGPDSLYLHEAVAKLDGVSGYAAEMGLGSGFQSIAALLLNPGITRMVGVEIDARARNVATFNGLINGVGERLVVVEDREGLEEALNGNRIQLAISNPPFILMPEEVDIKPQYVRDLPEQVEIVGPSGRPRIKTQSIYPKTGYGGTDGLQITREFLDILFPLMADTGRILIYSAFASRSAPIEDNQLHINDLLPSGWDLHFIPQIGRFMLSYERMILEMGGQTTRTLAHDVHQRFQGIIPLLGQAVDVDRLRSQFVDAGIAMAGNGIVMLGRELSTEEKQQQEAPANGPYFPSDHGWLNRVMNIQPEFQILTSIGQQIGYDFRIPVQIYFSGRNYIANWATIPIPLTSTQRDNLERIGMPVRSNHPAHQGGDPNIFLVFNAHVPVALIVDGIEAGQIPRLAQTAASPSNLYVIGLDFSTPDRQALYQGIRAEMDDFLIRHPHIQSPGIAIFPINVSTWGFWVPLLRLAGLKNPEKLAIQKVAPWAEPLLLLITFAAFLTGSITLFPTLSFANLIVAAVANQLLFGLLHLPLVFEFDQEANRIIVVPIWKSRAPPSTHIKQFLSHTFGFGFLMHAPLYVLFSFAPIFSFISPNVGFVAYGLLVLFYWFAWNSHKDKNETELNRLLSQAIPPSEDYLQALRSAFIDRKMVIDRYDVTIRYLLAQNNELEKEIKDKLKEGDVLDAGGGDLHLARYLIVNGDVEREKMFVADKQVSRLQEDDERDRYLEVNFDELLDTPQTKGWKSKFSTIISLGTLNDEIVEPGSNNPDGIDINKLVLTWDKMLKDDGLIIIQANRNWSYFELFKKHFELVSGESDSGFHIFRKKKKNPFWTKVFATPFVTNLMVRFFPNKIGIIPTTKEQRTFWAHIFTTDEKFKKNWVPTLELVLLPGLPLVLFPFMPAWLAIVLASLITAALHTTSLIQDKLPWKQIVSSFSMRTLGAVLINAMALIGLAILLEGNLSQVSFVYYILIAIAFLGAFPLAWITHRDWNITFKKLPHFQLTIGGNVSRRRILVVDDSDNYREQITNLLEMNLSDVDITPVRNAEEALSLIQAGQKFDLVISDLNMPGLQGNELYDTLISLDPDYESRFILISLDSRPENYNGTYISKQNMHASLSATVSVKLHRATHPYIVKALQKWSGDRINLAGARTITVGFEEVLFGFFATAFITTGWLGLTMTLLIIPAAFSLYHAFSSNTSYRRWENITALFLLRAGLGLFWFYGSFDPLSFVITLAVTFALHEFVYNRNVVPRLNRVVLLRSISRLMKQNEAHFEDGLDDVRTLLENNGFNWYTVRRAWAHLRAERDGKAKDSLWDTILLADFWTAVGQILTNDNQDKPISFRTVLNRTSNLTRKDLMGILRRLETQELVTVDMEQQTFTIHTDNLKAHLYNNVGFQSGVKGGTFGSEDTLTDLLRNEVGDGLTASNMKTQFFRSQRQVDRTYTAAQKYVRQQIESGAKEIIIPVLGAAYGVEGYDVAMAAAVTKREMNSDIPIRIIISDVQYVSVDIAKRGHFDFEQKMLYEFFDAFAQEHNIPVDEFFSENRHMISAKEFREKWGIDLHFERVDVLSKDDYDAMVQKYGKPTLIVARNIHYTKAANEKTDEIYQVEHQFYSLLANLSHPDGQAFITYGLSNLYGTETLQHVAQTRMDFHPINRTKAYQLPVRIVDFFAMSRLSQFPVEEIIRQIENEEESAIHINFKSGIEAAVYWMIRFDEMSLESKVELFHYLLKKWVESNKKIDNPIDLSTITPEFFFDEDWDTIKPDIQEVLRQFFNQHRPNETVSPPVNSLPYLIYKMLFPKTPYNTAHKVTLGLGGALWEGLILAGMGTSFSYIVFFLGLAVLSTYLLINLHRMPRERKPLSSLVMASLIASVIFGPLVAMTTTGWTAFGFVTLLFIYAALHAVTRLVSQSKKDQWSSTSIQFILMTLMHFIGFSVYLLLLLPTSVMSPVIPILIHVGYDAILLFYRREVAGLFFRIVYSLRAAQFHSRMDHDSLLTLLRSFEHWMRYDSPTLSAQKEINHILNQVVYALNEGIRTKSSESDRLRAELKDINELIRDINITVYRSQFAQRYLDRPQKTISETDMELLDEFSDRVKATSGKTVFDMGSGPGEQVSELTRRGLEVDASDRSPLFLHHLREKRNQGLVRDVHDTDLTELKGIPDNSYHGVRAQAVLHYFLGGHEGDANKVVSEMARIAKPGGLLYFRTRQSDQKRLHVDSSGRIHQYFDETALRNLLEQQGLENIQIYSTQEPANKHDRWLVAYATKKEGPINLETKDTRHGILEDVQSSAYRHAVDWIQTASYEPEERIHVWLRRAVHLLPAMSPQERHRLKYSLDERERTRLLEPILMSVSANGYMAERHAITLGLLPKDYLKRVGRNQNDIHRGYAAIVRCYMAVLEAQPSKILPRMTRFIEIMENHMGPFELTQLKENVTEDQRWRFFWRTALILPINDQFEAYEQFSLHGFFPQIEESDRTALYAVLDLLRPFEDNFEERLDTVEREANRIGMFRFRKLVESIEFPIRHILVVQRASVYFQHLDFTRPLILSRLNDLGLGLPENDRTEIPQNLSLSAFVEETEFLRRYGYTQEEIDYLKTNPNVVDGKKNRVYLLSEIIQRHDDLYEAIADVIALAPPLNGLLPVFNERVLEHRKQHGIEPTEKFPYPAEQMTPLTLDESDSNVRDWTNNGKSREIRTHEHHVGTKELLQNGLVGFVPLSGAMTDDFLSPASWPETQSRLTTPYLPVPLGTLNHPLTSPFALLRHWLHENQFEGSDKSIPISPHVSPDNAVWVKRMVDTDPNLVALPRNEARVSYNVARETPVLDARQGGPLLLPAKLFGLPETQPDVRLHLPLGSWEALYSMVRSGELFKWAEAGVRVVVFSNAEGIFDWMNGSVATETLQNGQKRQVGSQVGSVVLVKEQTTYTISIKGNTFRFTIRGGDEFVEELSDPLPDGFLFARNQDGSILFTRSTHGEQMPVLVDRKGDEVKSTLKLIKAESGGIGFQSNDGNTRIIEQRKISPATQKLIGHQNLLHTGQLYINIPAFLYAMGMLQSPNPKPFDLEAAGKLWGRLSEERRIEKLAKVKDKIPPEVAEGHPTQDETILYHRLVRSLSTMTGEFKVQAHHVDREVIQTPSGFAGMKTPQLPSHAATSLQNYYGDALSNKTNPIQDLPKGFGKEAITATLFLSMGLIYNETPWPTEMMRQMKTRYKPVAAVTISKQNIFSTFRPSMIPEDERQHWMQSNRLRSNAIDAWVRLQVERMALDLYERGFEFSMEDVRFQVEGDEVTFRIAPQSRMPYEALVKAISEIKHNFTRTYGATVREDEEQFSVSASALYLLLNIIPLDRYFTRAQAMFLKIFLSILGLAWVFFIEWQHIILPALTSGSVLHFVLMSVGFIGAHLLLIVARHMIQGNEIRGSPAIRGQLKFGFIIYILLLASYYSFYQLGLPILGLGVHLIFDIAVMTPYITPRTQLKHQIDWMGLASLTGLIASITGYLVTQSSMYLLILPIIGMALWSGQRPPPIIPQPEPLPNEPQPNHDWRDISWIWTLSPAAHDQLINGNNGAGFHFHYGGPSILARPGIQGFLEGWQDFMSHSRQGVYYHAENGEFFQHLMNEFESIGGEELQPFRESILAIRDLPTNNREKMAVLIGYLSFISVIDTRQLYDPRFQLSLETWVNTYVAYGAHYDQLSSYPLDALLLEGIRRMSPDLKDLVNFINDGTFIKVSAERIYEEFARYAKTMRTVAEDQDFVRGKGNPASALYLLLNLIPFDTLFKNYATLRQNVKFLVALLGLLWVPFVEWQLLILPALASNTALPIVFMSLGFVAVHLILIAVQQAQRGESMKRPLMMGMLLTIGVLISHTLFFLIGIPVIGLIIHLGIDIALMTNHIFEDFKEPAVAEPTPKPHTISSEKLDSFRDVLMNPAIPLHKKDRIFARLRKTPTKEVVDLLQEIIVAPFKKTDEPKIVISMLKGTAVRSLRILTKRYPETRAWVDTSAIANVFHQTENYVLSVGLAEFFYPRMKKKLREHQEWVQSQHVLEKSTVRIVVGEGEDAASGSGWAIAEDEAHIYLVTNAHITNLIETPTIVSNDPDQDGVTTRGQVILKTTGQEREAEDIGLIAVKKSEIKLKVIDLPSEILDENKVSGKPGSLVSGRHNTVRFPGIAVSRHNSLSVVGSDSGPGDSGAPIVIKHNKSLTVIGIVQGFNWTMKLFVLLLHTQWKKFLDRFEKARESQWEGEELYISPNPSLLKKAIHAIRHRLDVANAKPGSALYLLINLIPINQLFKDNPVLGRVAKSLVAVVGLAWVIFVEWPYVISPALASFSYVHYMLMSIAFIAVHLTLIALQPHSSRKSMAWSFASYLVLLASYTVFFALGFPYLGLVLHLIYDATLMTIDIIKKAESEPSFDWDNRYDYQPLLLIRDREVLKEQSLTDLVESNRMTPDDRQLVEEIDQKRPLRTDFNREEDVARLIEMGSVVEVASGHLIPIYWIESASDIPLERRTKLLKALNEGELLNKETDTELKSSSDLVLEYFDDRGDNRRVLLTSLIGHEPFILKYTHIHRSAVADQFELMESVVSQELQIKTNRGIHAAMIEKYGLDGVAVVQPGHYVEIGGTEIFTEGFIDGPTRQDFVPYLVETKGIPESIVHQKLARIEGRGLSRIWRSTRKINSGKVLQDLTGRNVKYVMVGQDIVAKYFDFEQYNDTRDWTALGNYMGNKQLPFLNHPWFLLGWVEGLGIEDSVDFFRTIDQSQDQLGLMIQLIIALIESENDTPTTLFDGEASPTPLEFIYAILINSRQFTITSAEEIESTYTTRAQTYSTPHKEAVGVAAKKLGAAFAEGVSLVELLPILIEIRSSYIKTRFGHDHFPTNKNNVKDKTLALFPGSALYLLINLIPFNQLIKNNPVLGRVVKSLVAVVGLAWVFFAEWQYIILPALTSGSVLHFALMSLGFVAVHLILIALQPHSSRKSMAWSFASYLVLLASYTVFFALGLPYLGLVLHLIYDGVIMGRNITKVDAIINDLEALPLNQQVETIFGPTRSSLHAQSDFPGAELKVVEVNHEANVDAIVGRTLRWLTGDADETRKAVVTLAPDELSDGLNTIEEAILTLAREENVNLFELKDRLTFQVSATSTRKIDLDDVLASAFGNATVLNPSSRLPSDKLGAFQARITLIQTTSRWTSIAGTFVTIGEFKISVENVVAVLLEMMGGKPEKVFYLNNIRSRYEAVQTAA